MDMVYGIAKIIVLKSVIEDWQLLISVIGPGNPWYLMTVTF